MRRWCGTGSRDSSIYTVPGGFPLAQIPLFPSTPACLAQLYCWTGHGSAAQLWHLWLKMFFSVLSEKPGRVLRFWLEGARQDRTLWAFWAPGQTLDGHVCPNPTPPACPSEIPRPWRSGILARACCWYIFGNIPSSDITLGKPWAPLLTWFCALSSFPKTHTQLMSQLKWLLHVWGLSKMLMQTAELIPSDLHYEDFLRCRDQGSKPETSPSMACHPFQACAYHSKRPLKDAS